MSIVSIYRFTNNGYLIHALGETKSGFLISREPFIRIAETDTSVDIVSNAIRAALSNDDTNRLPDPTNWNEFERTFLEKSRLKSARLLRKAGTMLVQADTEGDSIVFLPTTRAEDANFLHKDRKEAVKVSFSASNEEIIKGLDFAFRKCD